MLVYRLNFLALEQVVFLVALNAVRTQIAPNFQMRILFILPFRFIRMIPNQLFLPTLRY